MDDSHRRALLTLTTASYDPIALRKASDSVRQRRVRLGRAVTVFLALCGVLCALSLVVSLARPHAAVAATRVETATAPARRAVEAPATPLAAALAAPADDATLPSHEAVASTAQVADAPAREAAPHRAKRKVEGRPGAAKKAGRSKSHSKRR